MVTKHPQKIGEANGMPSLPTGPTQVKKTGNVGSVDVFSQPIYPHLALWGSVMHLEGREWSQNMHKK